MKKFLIITFVFSLFFLTGCDNDTGKSGYEIFPETIELMLSQAEVEMERNFMPGMTVAFVDLDSGFTWTQGFGYADTVRGIPVIDETIFNMASISKPFTAIALMQLVEQGLIDLDEPITTYLPEFSMLPHPEYGGNYQNITIRMLLNHTAGIPRDYGAFERNLDGLGDTNWSFVGGNIQGLETYADIMFMGSLNSHQPEYMNHLLTNISALTMEFTEGIRFKYSNLGYTILGILIASVSGSDNYFEGFIGHMNEHILAPAQMNESTFVMTEEFTSFMAMPYLNALLGQEEVLFVNALSTGGLFSTAKDMARFMHIILASDGIFLCDEYLRKMFDFGEIEYGLGFMPMGTDAIGHTGFWQHSSTMLLNLEYGLGVFIAVNSGDSPTLFADMILASAIEERNTIE